MPGPVGAPSRVRQRDVADIKWETGLIQGEVERADSTVVQSQNNVFTEWPEILGQYRSVSGENEVAFGAGCDFADGAGAGGGAEAGANGVDYAHAERGSQGGFVVVEDNDQLSRFNIGGGDADEEGLEVRLR